MCLSWLGCMEPPIKLVPIYSGRVLDIPFERKHSAWAYSRLVARLNMGYPVRASWQYLSSEYLSRYVNWVLVSMWNRRHGEHGAERPCLGIFWRLLHDSGARSLHFEWMKVIRYDHKVGFVTNCKVQMQLRCSYGYAGMDWGSLGWLGSHGNPT
jgi:hypothetical protein